MKEKKLLAFFAVVDSNFEQRVIDSNFEQREVGQQKSRPLLAVTNNVQRRII